MDISGHFFTIVQSNPASRTLTIGTYVQITNEAYPGDVIRVYSFPTWRILGTATIAISPVQVAQPSGIPYAVDQELFQNSQQFSQYIYYQVGVSCLGASGYAATLCLRYCATCHSTEPGIHAQRLPPGPQGLSIAREHCLHPGLSACLSRSR